MSSSSKPKTAHKRTMRIMLLGIGGSGKSTFSKQMQIIHQGQLPVEVAKTYRGILLTNVIIGLKAICASKQDLEDSENYKKSRWILTVDENWDDMDEDIIERIRSLWKDEGIREAWREIKDKTLIQLEYLMENFDRYLEKDFIPNNDDILRARQRTTGGELYTFEEKGTVWELTDVGGQYSERTKWEGYFNERPPHAVIFFLALDEYNIPNTEIKTNQEKYPSKLKLAMSIFKELLCTPGLILDHKICRIVFLNKIDIFQEKINDDNKWADFEKEMDYTGDRTVKAATDFIERKLNQMNKSLPKYDDYPALRIHVTNSLDTALMTKIAADIKTSILEGTMADFGL